MNYALATFDALRRTAQMKVTSAQETKLKIHTGAEKVYVRGAAPPPPPPEAGTPPEEAS